MAILTTLILTLIVIALYYVLRAISPEFKRATRWITIASNILFAIALIFGVLIYLDFSALAKEFPKTTQLFMLDDKGSIPVAFTISFAGQTDVTKAIKAIPLDELRAIAARYRMGDYASVLGSNYKMFIIKRAFFESTLPESMDMLGVSLSRLEILNIIGADDSIDVMVEIISERTGLDDVMKPLMKSSLVSQLKTENNDDFRTLIFATALMQSLSKDGTISPLQNKGMMEAYRNNTLMIYPETLFFKVLKLIPKDVFEQASALNN